MSHEIAALWFGIAVAALHIAAHRFFGDEVMLGKTAISRATFVVAAAAGGLFYIAQGGVL